MKPERASYAATNNNPAPFEAGLLFVGLKPILRRRF